MKKTVNWALLVGIHAVAAAGLVYAGMAQLGSDDAARLELAVAPALPSAVEGSEAPDQTQGCASALAALEPSTSVHTAAPIELTADEQAHLETVVAGISDWSFHYDEYDKPANANLFLHLAATSSEPTVVVAALDGMTHVFVPPRVSGFEKDLYKDKVEVTPAYDAAVLQHLQSDDPRIRDMALKAAEVTLQKALPDKAILAVVISTACDGSDVGRRIAALRLMDQIKNPRKEVEEDVLLSALEAEHPAVITVALEELSPYRSVKDTVRLRALVDGLLTHEDAGLRGRAAQALGNLAGAGNPGTEAAGQRLMELLDDPSGYVRGYAMLALGDIEYLPATHAIVAKLDSDASDQYELRGFTELDGSEGKLSDRASVYETEGAAAVRALWAMSYGVDERFSYEIDYAHQKRDLAKAIVGAKAWYERHRESLPKAPANKLATRR